MEVSYWLAPHQVLQTFADGAARRVCLIPISRYACRMGTSNNPPPLMVRDLAVRARDGQTLLEVAVFDVAPGEVVAVRGPSGAGKSTLLHVLAGLIQPSSGHVHWGETDLAGLQDQTRTAFRRKMIGMVFQDHLLFDELTAVGNAGLAAAYAPRAERAGIEHRAAALLERLGVAATGRRAARYSGGERQRIAVARALATNPPVILADEPTASLDRVTADRLIDDLFAYAGGQKTLIIASHDPAIHARAGRLASVVDGKLRVAARG